jgi:hypothetical protein
LQTNACRDRGSAVGVVERNGDGVHGVGDDAVSGNFAFV